MSKPTPDNITLDKLKLDANNPRLPKSLQGLGEKAIIEFMLLEASTLELMQAIGENDYFPGEQLLVIRDEKNIGKYIVVEGNRRLTAVKLLNDVELASVQQSKVKKVYEEAEFHPTEIPCLVFDDKDEILKYLGYRHITGVKSWRLLEKARYLYGLYNNTYNDLSFYEACRELAKSIGSRRDYVERIIIGFEIYTIIEENAFYKIHGLDDTNFYFNYLSDSLNRSNIRDFIGVDLSQEEPLANLDRKNIKVLTKWFFEKDNKGKTRVLGDSSGLNRLNKVLGNEEAKKAFEANEVDLNEAYEITDGLDDVFRSEVKRSIKSLEKADVVSYKVKSFYPDLSKDLKGIHLLIRKISDLKKSLEEDDF